MARTKTEQQRIDEALKNQTAEIQRAFYAAVAEIRDTAQINEIIRALEAGNIERAVELVGVDPAPFRLLEPPIRATYTEGGFIALQNVPVFRDQEGAKIVVRFDPGNPRAETWLRSHSATLITDITTDQRNAVRTALADGMAKGLGSRTTALDLVGRLNRVTGQREGGIIGLTQVQTDYAIAARDELLSGDPKELRNYLTRQARNRRYDAMVLKAIREEKPLPAEAVTRITGAYKDSLLSLRGSLLGRTEATAALNSGRIEAMRQTVEEIGIDQAEVTKTWRATRDARTRDSHMHLDGKTVGLNARFPNGLEYPGDPRGPASEIIACRCTLSLKVKSRAA